jgi:hypothetical protein
MLMVWKFLIVVLLGVYFLFIYYYKVSIWLRVRPTVLWNLVTLETTVMIVWRRGPLMLPGVTVTTRLDGATWSL